MRNHNQMMFSLEDLQNYLFREFGIVPELVGWDTDFRQGLHLTESEITDVAGYVCDRADISDSTAIGQTLTNVFDLMVYVLLRSTEPADIETYFSALLYPILELSPDEFRPFGVALLHQINLN